jgi:hypothetical protein
MSGFNKVNNVEACIDVRTLPDNVPSLCIPRVFSNITEARIRKVINDLNMGDIERIDMVSKTTEKGEKYNRVFIHFRKWASDGNAAIARERLVNGKEIKIVYDEPWFWKVSAYRKDAAKSRGPAPPRKYEAKKPSFCFDSQDQNQTRQNQNQNPRQNQNQTRQNQNPRQNQNQNQRPRSPPPPTPPTPPHTPPPLEEGPTGEYVDVPTIDYGKVSFTKRKPLKTKVALTIVNPDEISPRAN